MKNLETFKNFNWKAKSSLLEFGASVESDWRLIFVSTAALVLIVTALNILMFVKVDKGEIFVVDEPAAEGAQTLDLEKLRSTLLYYQNKAVEFEKITAGTITVVDPSL